MKLARLALTVLLALAVNSNAIEADNPASCRQKISELTNDASDSKAPSPESIEVLVWNVQKFENHSALRWLKETPAQIIMAQESIASIQLAFADDLNATQVFSPGYRTFNNETSGVGIITKFETLVSCAWQHQEPWLLTPKATLVSALQTGKQMMLAVNLHAINFSIGTHELQDQIDAISVVIEDYDGPIVVAGDFNTWSKARTEVLERFIFKHELSATNFQPDHRVRPFSYPLDHILTKNLNVLAAQSERSELSDHTPLIMTVTSTQELNPELAFSHPTKIERPLSKR
ncbi:MAG: endonuclease/exonuclease/phosphatase family protein [Halieaceae bacterium]|nr:endonuclease/exonuclease/phosphatase family protein [Halieaceae bacterium]